MTITARRAREKQARRETIVQAARQIAERDGFANMTMDSVAEASELSKGALYLYFENKDALCAAIAVDEIDHMSDALHAELDNAGSGLDAIRRLLTFYAAFVTQRPHLFRFMLAWLSETQPMDDQSVLFKEYKTRVGEMMELVGSAMVRGKMDGTIRADIKPVEQTIQLWTSFLGVILANVSRDNFARRFPQPVNFDALIPLHIEMMMRALAPVAANDQRGKL